MINKQNLWFITLFSLILILGIYYVSIDDEASMVLKNENTSKNVIEITEEDALVALEVEKEEEKQSLLKEYQDILLSNDTNTLEKNNAYENIQELNNYANDELKTKNNIKERFKLNSYVKIKDNNVSIVIASNKHNTELANSIMRTVQELFKEEKYISVRFNS